MMMSSFALRFAFAAEIGDRIRVEGSICFGRPRPPAPPPTRAVPRKLGF